MKIGTLPIATKKSIDSLLDIPLAVTTGKRNYN